MQANEIRRFARRTTLASAGALAATAIALAFVEPPADAAADLAPALLERPVAAADVVRCLPDGPDPFLIDLVPTAHANGARGRVTMRFAESPFGVSVTDDGHHVYHAEIRTTGLAAAGDALVVWAATPSLDDVAKLGTLSADGTLTGTIAFNKFLVFVTAETSADVARWAGPILLRGISPSGRMHTMAGHGPFQGESCAKWGFAPGGGL